MSQFKIRPYKQEDHNFITEVWLKNFKNSSYFAKRIRHSIFFKWHNQIINKLISRSNVLTAVLPDEEEAILGFIVCEKQNTYPVIHYTYVKEDFRQFGIAKALVEQALEDSDEICYFTHWTYDSNTMIEKFEQRDVELIYDPYRGIYL